MPSESLIILCNPGDLAAAVRAGDPAVLDRLSRCYGAHMLAMGRRWCRSPEEAQDAVQDAWEAAGRHLGDFRGEGQVEGWLLRMVQRACQRMRRGGKNAAHEPFDELQREGTELGEDLLALGEALLQLAPLDRSLVLLADGEQWTAPELAERTGLTAGAVRTRLSRARRQLRAVLEAEGGRDSAESAGGSDTPGPTGGSGG